MKHAERYAFVASLIFVVICLSWAVITIFSTAADAQEIGRPPRPHYVHGQVFNSPGGDIEDFYALRARLVHSHEQVRLGNCVSACIELLRVPGACVEPWGRFGFHAVTGTATGRLYAAETRRLWSAAPAAIQRRLALVRYPQYVSGRAMIAAGARPCR